jgi:Leucine-rich repeat (LRR) protein
MKKIILLLAWATIAINAAMAQEYHSHDLGKLKAFLVQPSAEEGKTNGEQLGLTKADIDNWNNNEDWVANASLTWTRDTPKRILNITMWGGRHLSGTLDLSGCTALNALYCWGNQLTSLNVDDCADLDDLQPSDNQLTSLNLKHNTRLRVLFCGQNLLADLDLTNNTNLQHLDCNGNQLTTLDLTNNTKLYALRCFGNPLLDMYVPFTTPLPHIRYNNATGDNSLVVVLNDVDHATLHV